VVNLSVADAVGWLNLGVFQRLGCEKRGTRGEGDYQSIGISGEQADGNRGGKTGEGRGGRD